MENELALTARGDNALDRVQMSDLDVQVTTAKAYPRAVGNCIRELTDYVETLGPEFAESLFYVLPHYKDDAGKAVEGPSVRMAEIAVGVWGNLRVQSRTGAVTANNVTAEAVVWDLEKNTAVSVEKTRSIVGKKGRYSENMIQKTALAAQSIARRDAVFQIIPRPVIEKLTARAKDMAASSDNLAARRVALLSYFTKMGIEESVVLKHLGCADVKDITPAKLAEARGIANAIKDGACTAAEAFGLATDTPNTLDGLAEKLEE